MLRISGVSRWGSVRYSIWGRSAVPPTMPNTMGWSLSSMALGHWIVISTMTRTCFSDDRVPSLWQRAAEVTHIRGSPTITFDGRVSPTPRGKCVAIYTLEVRITKKKLLLFVFWKMRELEFISIHSERLNDPCRLSHLTSHALLTNQSTYSLLRNYLAIPHKD